MFNSLYTVQINSLKTTSAIKVATMKIMDDFCYEWKPLCAYRRIDTLLVSTDEWHTKEGTGKSIGFGLVVFQCHFNPRGAFCHTAVYTYNASFIATVEVHLLEGINQAINQSVENSIFKFHSNFLKAF